MRYLSKPESTLGLFAAHHLPSLQIKGGTPVSEDCSDANTTIQELIDLVAAFRDARDWARFHSPKNLSMAIAIEAAELMECFQWIEADESQAQMLQPEARQAVAAELADVLAYCFSLASITGLDITTALRNKMAANAAKYPIEQFRGRF